MSFVKCSYLKGSKTVFFSLFLTQFSYSNHYMLWLTPIIPYPNHNTSSELLLQHALSWRTYQPIQHLQPQTHFLLVLSNLLRVLQGHMRCRRVFCGGFYYCVDYFLIHSFSWWVDNDYIEVFLCEFSYDVF